MYGSLERVMPVQDGRILTHQEEQIKWLQDASNSVKRNSFYMKRALVSPHRMCGHMVGMCARVRRNV